jgi:hypothetical protein
MAKRVPRSIEEVIEGPQYTRPEAEWDFSVTLPLSQDLPPIYFGHQISPPIIDDRGIPRTWEDHAVIVKQQSRSISEDGITTTIFLKLFAEQPHPDLYPFTSIP